MTVVNFDKIVKMYTEENKSTYEIAEKFNTYPNKVRRILKKHGYNLKDKSAAQKTALEKGRSTHPTKGKKRTYAEKLKISSSISDYWSGMSEEDRQDRVEQAKTRWTEMSEEDRQNLRDLSIQAIQRASTHGSKLENFILKALIKAGHRVEFHKKNLIPNEKLEIDLYIPVLKTIIEVDGPSHFLPVWGEEKLQKQIRADLHKNGLTLGRGYAIIRIKVLKNHISLKNKEDVANLIIDNLKKIENHFPPKPKRYIEIEL